MGSLEKDWLILMNSLSRPPEVQSEVRLFVADIPKMGFMSWRDVIVSISQCLSEQLA